ncbi:MULTISPECIES: hypothetical protein [unclassified Motilimonas]|uniref:hypothetical protein n=1 Tax=Motilimonas TaxID=1914248 RepID=UPI001E512D1A|nr:MULTISPECIES: hypothetical protein [unclassified Motilimonas]MCE0558018.1 hypothetical protein [Motilimonas sp. E26]MDO6526023.1 hypothetical protein [Motilimonas sp. 1_MG-2023]
MQESQSSGYKTQGSAELGAQLNALPALGSRLIDSYACLLNAVFALIKAKAKANLKMLIAIITLIATAVFLTCAVWVGLQVLIAFSLISLGLNVFAASGLVLVANLIAIYYLLSTASWLFDITYDEFIDGFFSQIK